MHTKPISLPLPIWLQPRPKYNYNYRNFKKKLLGTTKSLVKFKFEDLNFKSVHNVTQMLGNIFLELFFVGNLENLGNFFEEIWGIFGIFLGKFLEILEFFEIFFGEFFGKMS